MSGTGSGPGGRVGDGTDDGGRELGLELDRMFGEERRAAMARLASTLSHALGTPLNVISGRATMIGMRDMSQEQLADNARIIREQVRTIADMLSRVLGFVREGWPGPVPTDLPELARRVVRLMHPIVDVRGIQLELGEVEEIHAQVHAPRIEHVLVDLITHAAAVGGRGTRMSLSLSRRELEPPSYERGRASTGPVACFDLALHGVALPAPDYDYIHEPWLRVEAQSPEQRSLSMLYAVCFGIAREHRGWVQFHEEPGGAATFSLCWPLAA